MATPPSLHSQDEKVGSTLDANFGVDYVLDYRFATTGKAQAEAEFVKLIEALNHVGLSTEVRKGDNCAVLIFVKMASESHLNAEVYGSRVQDWLYGVRTIPFERDMQKAMSAEPVTDAERLRLVYLLITKPTSEGGAGVTPKSGQFKCVQSIFAPQDHKFNKAWIMRLSSKYLLDRNDLAEIRDRFGEKIGFYFAFLQSYFMFLVFPAVFGLSAWLLLGQFSPIYAIVNGLWGIIFIEYWKKEERNLAVEWGVRGVSRIQHKRPEFKSEREIKDPLTGETVKLYSPIKRLGRQLLQVPFATAAAIGLGGLIAGCFAIEIFISEVYGGPFKGYLIYLPTVILTTVMPTLSVLLTGFASRLTQFENYETTDAHDAAMVQKLFVLNFITSYLPIFLTAFVYVPFAQVIVPYLDVFHLAIKPFADSEKPMTLTKGRFQINPDRLKKQVIYFTVTAQIVNFFMEIVVPYVKRAVFRKVKEVKADIAAKRGACVDSASADDHPDECEFLTRVRNEAELPVYDVTSDLREMVVQFGYLSLFSVVWPLTGVSFLINNWIELRGDALKIAMETQRPVPWRGDSIGTWLDSLAFLSWLGSLSSAALVYLFSGGGLGPDGSPWNIKAWGLLLTMFFSEHIYLGVRVGVRNALSKIDSPGQRKERADQFAVKQQYLQDIVGQEAADEAATNGIVQGEKISQTSFDDARQSTLQGRGTPGERFWTRQQGPAESISVGRAYIAKAAPAESKKDK